MKKLLHMRKGQSTVELALILPVLAVFIGFIIYAYKINHKISDNTSAAYAEKIYKYHNDDLLYDPAKGMYVPSGQYSEHIPNDAVINPAQLAAGLAMEYLADLGLNELFSAVHLNDQTYAGAFAKGFSYSLAGSAATTFAETGSFKDMNAKDLENATWAGGASALSSNQATNDFQGGDGKTSGTQEFFGSGLQAGGIGFMQSHGDLKAAGTSAAGGMINSDTTKDWAGSGSDFTQIMKGAGLGAVQSSASGAINGNLSAKNVLVGTASGAVQTEAFAKTLPLTGSDPKNSAMYGAFNGAFSSAVSGGNMKSTLVSAGTGALGTQQTAGALGGQKSFGYRAVSAVGGAAGQMIQGNSLQAIGQGALSGAVSSGAGWAGNQVSGALSNTFKSAKNSDDAEAAMDGEDTSEKVVDDPVFQESASVILDDTIDGVLNAETLKSLEGVPANGGST